MEELGLGPNGGLVYCMEYPSLQYFLIFVPFLTVGICFVFCHEKELLILRQ